MEPFQIPLQRRQLFFQSDRLEGCQPVLLGHIQIFPAVPVQNGLRRFHDVLSVIAVFRHLCVLAEELQIPGIHGFRQMQDLAARVIDVVFRSHIVAGCAVQTNHGIPVGRTAGMADVERSRGIGGYVFHKDRILFPAGQIAVGCAFFQNAAQFRVDRIFREIEIDESRTGDIHMIH